MVKVVNGVLLSVALIVVFDGGDTEKPVMTGKFCRLFGPVSGSCASFGVTPLEARSMPRPLLEKIELERMALPVPPTLVTPRPLAEVLKAIVLPAPAAAPPIVLPRTPAAIVTPGPALPRPLARAELVPMRLPCTRYPVPEPPPEPRNTPPSPFAAITLPAPAVVPPTWIEEPASWTPTPLFGSAALPPAFR